MIATTWAGAFLGLAIMVGIFCSVGLALPVYFVGGVLSAARVTR